MIYYGKVGTLGSKDQFSHFRSGHLETLVVAIAPVRFIQLLRSHFLAGFLLHRVGQIQQLAREYTGKELI